jgi:MFS transporter, PPP family, 3-phenylpropionic acid transporter
VPQVVLIAGFYFTFFGALGVFLPYFALWLTAHGFSATQATRVCALTPLMSLVAPPLFGLVADARRARVWLLRGCSIGSALAFGALVGAPGKIAVLVATALFAFCRSPLTALIDSTTLDHVHRHGGSYGRLRLWGSIGFLAAVSGGGVLAEWRGLPSLIAFATLLLVASAACALALPAPPPVKRDVSGAWRALLADRDLALFFAAATMAQLATAAYDSAFTLHLSRLGFHGRFIGATWSIGLVAEIVLLAISPSLLPRIGAPRALTIALAVAAARWTILSRVTSPLAILALQPTHGITFGLFWVASIAIVRDRGQAMPTAAQGLLSSAMGVGSLVGMNVAGALLERGGGRLLFGAAGAAAAGGCLLAWQFSRRCGESALS